MVVGTIQAVIFDYGGVLSTPPFAGLGAFERENGYPRGSLVRLLFGDTPPTGAERDSNRWAAYDGLGDTDGSPSDWHLLEIGKLPLAEFHDRLVERSPAYLGRPLDLSLYTRFLADWLVGIHWMVVHRVRRLRADGYRTAILTNNIAEWGPVWRSSIPMDLFDVVVDSCEVGLRKPDPEIFRLTCRRLAVTPEAAVFLDDSPRHVASAREVGLRGIVVSDPEQAIAELDEVLEEDQPQRRG